MAELKAKKEPMLIPLLPPYYEISAVRSSFWAFFEIAFLRKMRSNIGLLGYKTNLLTISNEQQSDLIAPISWEEALNGIRHLQNRKALGPDGFVSEFYKEFCDLLADPLLDKFNHSFLHNGLPQTPREANISLILKKRKMPKVLFVIQISPS